ncbi:hypothetical protein N7495_005933 [Penicillium taxi]|uniref:uncharacterized protein n=1 Tax=Penicillium taxi TaxID=168475 RepID=UPI0025459B62|nr:uncharacterized protein N7495_005933 [Penicillium taxi]KAJ5894242.1 hypothetical protein N7495_005933 [Penicillium taxi]
MNVRRDPIHYAHPNSQYEATSSVLQENTSYILLALVSVYLLIDQLGFAPISLIQAAWTLIVILTPSRLLVALDSRMSPSDYSSSHSRMSFHAKSESIQRIFSLENSPLSRQRSLSGIGNALLGNSRNAIPPGLGNWDNSCYQNSIIQGLASLESLAQFLGRNVNILAEKGSLSTHQALKEIIDDLNRASNYGNKLWIPADLKSMSSWQQQDAQEYFSKLVDQIDIEIQEASRGQTKNVGLKMAGLDGDTLRNICTHESESDHNIEKSSFRNPLEGLLAQRVGCMKCGYTEGLSLIPFNCLTVPLGGRMQYDVRDCLDQYMGLEPIEGVECAKCTLLRAQGQLKFLLDGVLETTALADESTPSRVLPDAVANSARTRLQAVETALEEDDYTEKTLAKECHIPSKNRVSTTKSRQAVVARSPQCLVVHINRSLFDEMTGMLKKNYATVKFPQYLDLNNWCLGTQSDQSISERPTEQWETNPCQSMLPEPGQSVWASNRHYELRAIITHYGRHENGHYVCYRKYPTSTFPAQIPDEVLQAEGEKEKAERWYRLSDDDVHMVSESHVMSQGGVFMLFYEAVQGPLETPEKQPTSPVSASYEPAESVSNFTMSEVADAESVTSRATSVSAPDRAFPHDEDIKTPVVPGLDEQISSPSIPMS